MTEVLSDQDGSPPLAYPALPSNSSFFSSSPAPPQHSRPSSSNPWARSGTFLLSGSTAPPIVNTRRAPPFRGHSTPSSSSSPSRTGTPSRQSPLQSPVLMTEGNCYCCGTRVRYPRDAGSFRCTVCDVANDVFVTTRRRNPSEFSPQLRSPVTDSDILELAENLSSTSSSDSARLDETDEELALRLHQLEVSGSGSVTTRSPRAAAGEALLSNHLVSSFASLEVLDNSFLPPSPPPSSYSTTVLPRYTTLRKLFDLVKERPEQSDLLRQLTKALLGRPGVKIDQLRGNWMIVLLESPVFSSTFNPNAQERRILYSRLIGLISNAPSSQHHHLVNYLSALSSTSSPRYPTSALLSHIQLLIPHISHLILSDLSPSLAAASWQVVACAKLASLYLAARNHHATSSSSPSNEYSTETCRINLSEFYVTAIDALGEEEWIQDFLGWEQSGRDDDDDDTSLYHEYESSKFRFCQYPFLLSLGVKKRLLDYENQRRIMDEAAAAIRSNLSSSYRNLYGGRGGGGWDDERQTPLLVLNVRRSRLVQDSLQQISINRENLRKSLRIKFEDEEGIDAGGLRKEWFLLLCRSLFSPSYGMFVTPRDEGTNLMWFNPGSVGLVEEEDHWLLGAVVGLACYHSDTLDVPLPLVTYKKLLGERSRNHSLADLAQFQPALARGLRQLLNYEESDLEDVFCRSFVGTYEAWGDLVEIELCEGGKDRPVTRENRQEYVSLLLDFIFDSSVSTQFEAFSNGFHEVCSGNALSLLRGEELELIVRGSADDEVLDVDTLRSVTTYDGFYENDQVIADFWEIFASFDGKRQRQLLAFMTASDRIPATGITSMHLKITCLGRVDSPRLPQGRTCFNELCLWMYRGGKARLERLLITAMDESEGFGLR